MVMSIPFGYLFGAAWLLWLVYWGVSAANVKQATRVESSLSRFGKYFLPLMVAAWMMIGAGTFAGTLLGERFVPALEWVAWLGFILTLAGLAFACWARAILGRNWSGVVQLKQDHELIVRGPYSIVRHPIYTGLLLAFFGSALAIGQWRALLATAIVAISFWRKLRLEERWMRELFGDRYVNYMRRVKALVPWVL
jgi:protein-S-isoprenylcysteine O-methyltransferase Ste14